MNSLTVNLHLLLTSFYQPTQQRFKIIIDAPTFPSDLYAIKSHMINHGLNPDDTLIVLEPRENEDTLQMSDIEQLIMKEGKNTAIVFFSGVNYLTGQVHNIQKMTALAHQQGCLVGFDIAHAAGNIPLKLHDENVDFAVGCSYKYLCSGPGGPGFAFIHASHHHKNLPRLSGWWGSDPTLRFQMDTQTDFIPYGGAASWQISTPSILATLPLIASLDVFHQTGIARLRQKSLLQTAFLLELLGDMNNEFSIITPTSPDERGCQISIRVHRDVMDVFNKLTQHNFICDYRPPNTIRVTPSPLMNLFNDILKFALCFRQCWG